MLPHLKIELNHSMSYKRENLNLEDTARKTLPKEVLEGPDGSDVDAPAATGREMQVQAGLRGLDAKPPLHSARLTVRPI